MKLLISLSSKDQIVSAVLHSKQLNNVHNSLQGYWEEFYFDNTRLWLTNSRTNDKFVIEFFEGTLGQSVYTAPWRTHSIKLPSGKYSIRLTADGASRWYNRSKVPIDISFKELFIVK